MFGDKSNGLSSCDICDPKASFYWPKKNNKIDVMFCKNWLYWPNVVMYIKLSIKLSMQTTLQELLSTIIQND